MIDAILAATGAAALPISLMVKVTLVLAIATAGTLLMSRASAATRHMVWGVTIIAVLGLPLLALAGPRWEVAWAGFAREPAELPVYSEGAARLEGGGAAKGAVDQSPPATMGTSGVAPLRETDRPGTGLPWLLIAAATWIVGALAILLRIVFGWLGTRRLATRSEPVTDPDWLQLLKDASWMLDVDRDVVLLRSASASMPMTWGTRRPTILLPAEADAWPDERRRVVLLHEMAHVARRDCLTQTIADVATAVYWFHPLVWFAAGQLRKERERACDDRVLTAGEGATNYAGHLLEVARAYGGQGMYRAAAIGMARPSQLEGRLLAVLDSARRRAAPARREIILTSVVAALALIPIAALQGAQPGRSTSPTLLEQVKSTIAESRNTGALPLSEQPAQSPATGGLVQADSVVDLRVPARPGGTVVLDVEGGDIRVVGWDSDVVELHAELRGSAASETAVELTSRNGRVMVLSEFTGRGRNRGGNHRFELRVPVSSNLEIASGGGGLTLENLSGYYTGGTGGGDIVLTRLAGRAELSTGGGNVRVSNSRLDGTVTTGGGNVNVVDNAGDLRGTTGGGNVRIENSQSQSALSEVTRVHTGGGDIQLLDLPAGADLSTGGGNITVRSVGGPLVANTGGGNIRINEAQASVDVNTGSGNLRLDSVRESVIARTGNGDIRVNLVPGARDRSIDLATGSGDVTLDLPLDFSGTIEVRITSRNPDPRQVRSDIPLSREIRTLDGRRALLATGAVGSGRDRVVVNTSSGNVTIRRGGGGPASVGAIRSESAMHHESDPVDAAFSEAFGEDFERHIEKIVSESAGSFAAGIAEFTASVTTSALGVAVSALERAEREGNLSAEARRELAEAREELRAVSADSR